MPELPDISVYIDALRRCIDRDTLCAVVIQNPFVLRTVEPPIDDLIGRKVNKIERIGKRIAIGLDEDYWIIFHLMIAGRFQWLDIDKKTPKSALAHLEFERGKLVFTEAGSKKRASIHLAHSNDIFEVFDPGGENIYELDGATFKKILLRNNHTLKRALTDPKLFSGIGNAYSDEILHAAKLSPIQQTQKLQDAEINALHRACVQVLTTWTEKLRAHYGEKFPTKVTAFRDGMAVHGQFGQPCPECATQIQRIRYATNEVNYCPRCQTNGKILADRSLSRLLKKDWPRSIEELENSNLMKSKS
ncbi:MAG: Fpg/Nei family DNA glycosylase [Gammaproteobacteria bacterium]